MKTTLLIAYQVMLALANSDYQGQHEEQMLVLDSERVYGVREPQGFTPANLTCNHGTTIKVNSVRFGYSTLDEIPLCGEKGSVTEPCVVDLETNHVDCEENYCRFPSVEDWEPNSFAKSKECGGGLKYWHICHDCIGADFAASELIDDVDYGEEAYSGYTNDDGYYYYYYADMYHPQVTNRFDVEGYEDITCENGDYIKVLSTKFGYNDDDLKSDSPDDPCVFDFTQRFSKELCKDTRCKSPTLTQFGLQQLAGCEQRPSLGLWQIYYTCEKGSDIDTHEPEKRTDMSHQLETHVESAHTDELSTSRPLKENNQNEDESSFGKNDNLQKISIAKVTSLLDIHQGTELEETNSSDLTKAPDLASRPYSTEVEATEITEHVDEVQIETLMESKEFSKNDIKEQTIKENQNSKLDILTNTNSFKQRNEQLKQNENITDKGSHIEVTTAKVTEGNEKDESVDQLVTMASSLQTTTSNISINSNIKESNLKNLLMTVRTSEIPEEIESTAALEDKNATELQEAKKDLTHNSSEKRTGRLQNSQLDKDISGHWDWFSIWSSDTSKSIDKSMETKDILAQNGDSRNDKGDDKSKIPSTTNSTETNEDSANKEYTQNDDESLSNSEANTKSKEKVNISEEKVVEYVTRKSEISTTKLRNADKFKDQFPRKANSDTLPKYEIRKSSTAYKGNVQESAMAVQRQNLDKESRMSSERITEHLMKNTDYDTIRNTDYSEDNNHQNTNSFKDVKEDRTELPLIKTVDIDKQEEEAKNTIFFAENNVTVDTESVSYKNNVEENMKNNKESNVHEIMHIDGMEVTKSQTMIMENASIKVKLENEDILDYPMTLPNIDKISDTTNDKSSKKGYQMQNTLHYKDIDKENAVTVSINKLMDRKTDTKFSDLKLSQNFEEETGKMHLTPNPNSYISNISAEEAFSQQQTTKSLIQANFDTDDSNHLETNENHKQNEDLEADFAKTIKYFPDRFSVTEHLVKPEANLISSHDKVKDILEEVPPNTKCKSHKCQTNNKLNLTVSHLIENIVENIVSNSSETEEEGKIFSETKQQDILNVTSPVTNDGYSDTQQNLIDTHDKWTESDPSMPINKSHSVQDESINQNNLGDITKYESNNATSKAAIENNGTRNDKLRISSKPKKQEYSVDNGKVSRIASENQKLLASGKNLDPFLTDDSFLVQARNQSLDTDERPPLSKDQELTKYGQSKAAVLETKGVSRVEGLKKESRKHRRERILVEKSHYKTVTPRYAIDRKKSTTPSLILANVKSSSQVDTPDAIITDQSKHKEDSNKLNGLSRTTTLLPTSERWVTKTNISNILSTPTSTTTALRIDSTFSTSRTSATTMMESTIATNTLSSPSTMINKSTTTTSIQNTNSSTSTTTTPSTIAKTTKIAFASTTSETKNMLLTNHIRNYDKSDQTSFIPTTMTTQFTNTVTIPDMTTSEFSMKPRVILTTPIFSIVNMSATSTSTISTTTLIRKQKTTRAITTTTLKAIKVNKGSDRVQTTDATTQSTGRFYINKQSDNNLDHNMIEHEQFLEPTKEEEIEEEIAVGIDQLKSELKMLLVFNHNVLNASNEIIKEATKAKVENFFESVSTSLNMFNFQKKNHKEDIASKDTKKKSSKKKEEIKTATSILNITADISKTLATTVELGSKVDIKLPNISMTVMKKKMGATNSSVWEADSLKVNLPDQSTIAGADSSITVSFTSYDNLGSMMNMNDDFSSSVLSVNVLGVEKIGNTIPLTKPMEFVLRHKPKNFSERKCVYWDFEETGWSQKGCYAVEGKSTENTTVCQCYHLTNFAVLVDVYGLSQNEQHKKSLDILTWIGCGISITSLTVCIYVFTTFRSAKNDRSTINSNLCFCILLAELFFLCGIGQTGYPSFCSVVAAVLHYLFLASFFWMLIAGFQIYVLLVEVFEPDGSRFVQYYLLGYIAPLLIVLCSLLMDTLLNFESVYGFRDFCWINSNIHLILTFLMPVFLIVGANVYFLCVAVYKIHIHSKESLIVHKSKTASLKLYVKGLFGLLFLLGVTWAFGIISVTHPSLTITYIFTILNSLHGFFIFIFNCVMNKKIRNEGLNKIEDVFSCLVRNRRRHLVSRKESTLSNTSAGSATSNTNSTIVKEYFLPERMPYTIDAKPGDKKSKQNALSITYYY